MQYDIFISYRRLDSEGRISGRDIARVLSKELKLRGYNPFFDYSEIKDDEFDKTILPAIQGCKIFLLILSKDAMDRCFTEGDWVRREITEAISYSCKIVNISPDHAFVSWPDNFPIELKSIEKIQIADIDMGSNFEITVDKLVNDRIKDVIDIPTHRLKSFACKEGISFAISGRQFTMPDEFYNQTIYDALKRSYI